ncbi:type II toxin-antitoxin system RelE/ParE family toxin [Actinotalea sp. K2]|uniref:type II toxin-antitoxin system RelE family toxin n=1 Tax=Actinotalea sp. K2 TaxID=2939438 RepID=UPI002016CAB7|nr:type II toxin-antitoxin system RelE/ParE family toxin [Actinotalea sp. K2]MCL3859569.1 type II toxin-antitoxin system RelE/ParE family toxin [Actinotalea sp. K2]
MTYLIRWAPPAQRATAETLPEAVATAVRMFASGALAEDPQRAGTRLTHELAGYWSARRGQYRVIYAIDDEAATVTIMTVDHRRDVYH